MCEALAGLCTLEDDYLSTGDMIEIAMDATFGAGNWKLIPYREVFF